MAEALTSLNNPKIKNIIRLQQKSAERKSQNLIVVEGFREIKLAVETGFSCHSLYVFEKIAGLEHINYIRNYVKEDSIFMITEAIFEKLAYRENSDGLIMLAVPEYLTPEEVNLSPNPLILVIESVEKPGNLGAMLRTADAAGVDAVLVCDTLTDLYNPNTIRASLGTVFSNQVVTCSNEEAFNWLKKNRIQIFSAALPSDIVCYQTDLTGSSAIVVGSEANGLTRFWLNHADEVIMIPMSGKVDSLNVSASAAIIVYEAVRQRLAGSKQVK